MDARIQDQVSHRGVNIDVSVDSPQGASLGGPGGLSRSYGAQLWSYRHSEATLWRPGLAIFLLDYSSASCMRRQSSGGWDLNRCHWRLVGWRITIKRTLWRPGFASSPRGYDCRVPGVPGSSRGQTLSHSRWNPSEVPWAFGSNCLETGIQYSPMGVLLGSNVDSKETSAGGALTL